MTTATTRRLNGTASSATPDPKGAPMIKSPTRPTVRAIFSRISRTSYTEVVFGWTVEREPGDPGADPETGEIDLIITARCDKGERRTRDYPGSDPYPEVTEVISLDGREWDFEDDLEADERHEIEEAAMQFAGREES